MAPERLLIVDDEVDALRGLQELLKEEGYEVMIAQSPKAAMDALDLADVDLIITDLRMPGMDGIELLKAARAQGLALPVIFVTAYGEVEPYLKAMDAGAFEYLVKPIDPDELIAKIHAALKKSKSNSAS